MVTALGGDLLNGIVKLTACVYRPWIRSDLIEPAGDSKTAATGYSFPSGHTQYATSIYGTIFVWQKDKRKWLAALCVLLIVLTGFSRNFLGVHTPQDVLAGFLEAAFMIWIVGLIQIKTRGNDKAQDLLTLAGIAVIILSLVYIHAKTYPMDYVDGKLLVNPQSMMNDIFKACGACLGLLIGGYIDRHYIHFVIPAGSPNLPILTVLGFMLMSAWKSWFAPATVVAAFGSHWGHMIARFIMVMFAMTIWPLVIRKHCGRTDQDQ